MVTSIRRRALRPVHHHDVRLVGYNSPVCDDGSVPIQYGMIIFENWFSYIYIHVHELRNLIAYKLVSQSKPLVYDPGYLVVIIVIQIIVCYAMIPDPENGFPFFVF